MRSLTTEMSRQSVPIVAALVNNTLRDLITRSLPIRKSSVDLTSELGVRIYWRSLSLVLIGPPARFIRVAMF